jgi:hypothetical protein
MFSIFMKHWCKLLLPWAHTWRTYGHLAMGSTQVHFEQIFVFLPGILFIFTAYRNYSTIIATSPLLSWERAALSGS